eukprot:jgi/Mesen1/2669/ME000167S01818
MLTRRSKTVEVEGGFHCRLVLPDPRDSTNDTIMWYREQAAPSSQDAHDRVAVMGLHWQWRELDEASAERKQRDERRREREQQQQQRCKRLGARRELQAVFMSDENRRIVEGLLRGGDAAAELAHGEGSASSLLTRGLRDAAAAAGEEGEEGPGEMDDWDGIDMDDEDYDDLALDATGQVEGEDGEGSEAEGDGEVEGEGEEVDEESDGEEQELELEEEEAEEGEAGSTSDVPPSESDGELDDWELHDSTAAASAAAAAVAEEGAATSQPGGAASTRGGRGAGALRGRGGRRGGTDQQVTEAAAPSSSSPGSADALCAQLLGLGFREADVKRALRECPREGGAGGALDWLVLHAREEDLPARYAPDASQSAGVPGPRPTGERLKQAVARLQAYGYSASAASSALFSANGSEADALCRLYEELAGGVATAAAESKDGGGEGRGKGRRALAAAMAAGEEELKEMRAEERVALDAIYGEDAVCVSDERVALRLPLGADKKETLTLEALFPATCRYPEEPPVIALSARALPAVALQKLTQAAAAQAWRCAGSCMLYEIACSVTEDAAAMPLPPPLAQGTESEQAEQEVVEEEEEEEEEQEEAQAQAELTAMPARSSHRDRGFSRKEPPLPSGFPAPAPAPATSPIPALAASSLSLAIPALPRSLSLNSEGLASPRTPGGKSPYLPPGVLRTMSGRLAEEALLAAVTGGSAASLDSTGGLSGSPLSRSSSLSGRHAEVLRGSDSWHPPAKAKPVSAAARAESRRLSEEWTRWRKEPRTQEMRRTREKLPAFKERAALLAAVARCPVTVVCGQTGCGKSTQLHYRVSHWGTDPSSLGCYTYDRVGKAADVYDRLRAPLEPLFFAGEATSRDFPGTVHGAYATGLRAAEECRHMLAASSAFADFQLFAPASAKEIGAADAMLMPLQISRIKRSERTRLLFCTTGILLRRLLSDPELQGLTHVIVDEVHERSVDGDLLLLLLRALLQRQLARGGTTCLRVILMSATVDADLFAAYFKGAIGRPPGVISIPGFTHPVRELFLEDALEMTGVRVGRGSRYAKKGPRKGPESTPGSEQAGLHGSTPQSASVAEDWEAAAAESAKGNGNGSRNGSGNGDGDGNGPAEEEYSQLTVQSLAAVDEEMLHYELIEAVVYQILQDRQDKAPGERYFPLVPQLEGGRTTSGRGQGGGGGGGGGNGKGRSEGPAAGAILVFLPGMAEIRRMQSTLQGSRRISEMTPRRGLWVLPLHGSLSAEEQRRVFNRPPAGITKVVLATNIAETSITIDDVDSWVSQASAQQRRGRAGRVQPGCCIRLFSRRQFRTMQPQQTPEMLRVPLQSLCLQVKSMLPGRVEATLGQALTPPSEQAIRAAVTSLQMLSAFDGAQELTPLGCHLARMPVDARVGKMLLFACMMRCLDPVLTIAAAVSGKAPFVAPMERRSEASSAKLRLAGATKSDHMAVVHAFNGWARAREGGWQSERDFCDANFVSREALVALEATRIDLAGVLVDLGFAPAEYYQSVWSGGSALRSSEARALGGGHALDANSGSIRIVKAALCAGFYPNIVRVQHPETTYQRMEHGTVAKDAAAHELRYFTRADGRAFLHPGSVNFVVGQFESPWLVYGEKVKTSKVYIRESSMVPAYGLLLFGGEIGVKHDRQVITVDGWMEFEAPARIAVLIRELRAKVAELLAEKIKSPGLDIASSPVMAAVVRLLTTDGY